MTMNKFIHTVLIASSLITSAISAQAAPGTNAFSSGSLECGTSIYGAWVTNEGKSVVNIYDCETSGICGDVVKFSGNAKYNELPAEIATPLSDETGPRVLSEFEAKSSNKFKGRIFNPRNGKSYKSTLKISEMGDLKVKGCLGPVCQTKTWMRPKVCSS